MIINQTSGYLEQFVSINEPERNQDELKMVPCGFIFIAFWFIDTDKLSLINSHIC